MKILLKGYYGFGNLGDDILMIVSYKFLKEKYPDATITVFSNNSINNKESESPEGYSLYIKQMLYENIQIIDWTFKGHFDLIFYGGGGHYFDHSRGSKLLSLVNPIIIYLLGPQRLSNLESIVRKILMKPLNQTADQIIGIGIGIGRFTSGSKSLLQQLTELWRYNYLWVRDNYSFNYLTNYRFRRKLEKYTDLAFISKYWTPNAIADKPQSVKKIGVVLMYVNHKESVFYTQLKIFIELAHDIGLEVSLFLFDEIHDRPVYSEFSNQKINTWQPTKMGLEDYLLEFKKCQIVISLRAHGAILAGILGIVPICIESSLKLKEVAKMFPNSGKLLSMESDAQALMNTIGNIALEYPKHLKQLRRDLVINHKAANDGVENLSEFLR